DIGFCVHGLVHDPDDRDRIWRQEHTGMFRSTDGGESWHAIEEGLPSTFGFPIVRDHSSRALFSFPLDKDEYRLPAEGRFRVYRSRNDGDSWEPLEKGLPTNFYAGVLRGAMATDHDGGVYVGSTAGTVHITTDGGESWQNLEATLPRILSVDVYPE
ncbi:MAG: exo-alpha-sialidase, partial [Planctomycetes bacterium]|nr:exo-alpha-sialidase [Planctomycetota bacterium]